MRLIWRWQAKQAKSPKNDEKIGKHANLAAAAAAVAGWNPRLGPWTHLSQNCSKSWAASGQDSGLKRLVSCSPVFGDTAK